MSEVIHEKDGNGSTIVSHFSNEGELEVELLVFWCCDKYPEKETTIICFEREEGIAIARAMLKGFGLNG